MDVERELQYRIPKKVTHNATLYSCCTCPSCGNVVDETEKWGDRAVRIMHKYCVYCGQALDWTDEEKQMVGFRE